MPITFTRNLGHAPGVQLNRLIDNSELPGTLIGDRSFGVVMRSNRGRIDKAMEIEFGTLTKKLGAGEPIRANALNEAWAQLYEALMRSNGTAIVSRLVRTSQAVTKWIVVSQVAPVAPATANTYTFSVADTQATSDYILQIRHLGCHNDGIKVSLWADSVTVGGVEQPTKILNMQLFDANNVQLFSFQGSTDPNAKDDYGRSYYLPDVISAQTDEVIVVVGDNTEFKSGEALYGHTDLGSEKWLASDVLIAFIEGDHSYTVDDYQAAMDRLKHSQYDFSYLASGGTQSSTMLWKLATLAFETNRQLRFDIDGRLSLEAASAFVESLNLSSAAESHLLQAFWMPVKSDDFSGLNPNGYIGAAMLNVALTCAKNIALNSKGFASKNYPTAGIRYPIPRSGLRQAITLSDLDLSNLSKRRINPVVFDTFSSGSVCVFRDQITQALVDNSLRKLISVVDMSTDIDDRVTRFGKGLVNSFPMTVAVKRMKDFLEKLFSSAKTSGWIVPGELKSGYSIYVAPNEARPYDVMDVQYAIHYDGAVRQIMVTQTLSR